MVIYSGGDDGYGNEVICSGGLGLWGSCLGVVVITDNWCWAILPECFMWIYV